MSVYSTIDYLINVCLKSACPPPDAVYQYPGFTRPGNNIQSMPGVYRDARGDWGHDSVRKTQTTPGCEPSRFSKYVYIR